MSAKTRIFAIVFMLAVLAGITVEILVLLNVIDPIYGNCRSEVEGWTCDLQGYRWH